MTSLAEVYEGLGEEATPRQLYAGTGLFVGGALLVVAGIIVATTGVLSPFGLNDWQSWQPAGILAGLGVPAVFLGIFTVLPASREVRAAAVIGASVAVLGVTLFIHAYPTRWIGNSPNLTPLVTTVYFLGTITTFWCLFTAVANFTPRNDPGGTVELEVSRGGETRVVEVDRRDLEDALDESGTVTGSGSVPADADVARSGTTGASGVGLFGSDPDGEVPTQTSLTERTAGAVRSATSSVSGATDSFSGTADGTGDPRPASDGGATEPGIRTPADDAEVLDSRADPATTTDSYCGNCTHFEYVQTSRGMRPFCELDDGIMDDMDACDRWEPNQLQ